MVRAPLQMRESTCVRVLGDKGREGLFLARCVGLCLLLSAAPKAGIQRPGPRCRVLPTSSPTVGLGLPFCLGPRRLGIFMACPEWLPPAPLVTLTRP